MIRIFTLILTIIITVSCKEEGSKVPISPMTEIELKTERTHDALDNLIKVEYPVPGQVITSPLDIIGEARGYWFFEANATAELLDGNMIPISKTYTTAMGEWMTENWVPFTGTMTFEHPSTASGFLVLHKANASGLEEHNMSDTIPVKFRR